MDDKLREQFLAATIRLKKMESMLVSDCEMQINELVILMSITKGCACGKSCGRAKAAGCDGQRRFQIDPQTLQNTPKAHRVL